jgi:hypothetical protein
MSKIYTSVITRRAPRPRSKRLRDSGIGSASGAVVVMGASAAAASSPALEGDGHTHANKPALDQIRTDADGYQYLVQLREVETGAGDVDVVEVTEKVKSGYADEARSLTDDSPVWDAVLRKDRDERTDYALSAKSLSADEGITAGGDVSGKNVMAEEDVIAAGAVSGHTVDADEDITAGGDVTACGKVQTEEGLYVGDFRAGMLDGTGAAVYKDALGNTVIEADVMNVRKKATFAELEVRKFTFTSGDTAYTSAGCKVLHVRRQPSGDYRCYWLAEDEGVYTSNDWHVGDQAMARTSNIVGKVTRNAQNRYYWRLVVGVGDETLEDGRLYHYIDLSDTLGLVTLTVDGVDHVCVGCDTSVANDAPQDGDAIVQLGSQTDEARQYAYIVYVSDGRRVDYDGINEYDLSSHIVEIHSREVNYIRAGRLEVINEIGVTTPLVTMRGAWYEGAVSYHYDSWSDGNATWLCIIGKGQSTTERPNEESGLWIRQTFGEVPLLLSITTDEGGNILRNGFGAITLRAVATRGGVDVTAEYPATAFSWTRQSGHADYDTAWNARHERIGPTCVVNAEDVWKKAVFDCILNIG